MHPTRESLLVFSAHSRFKTQKITITPDRTLLLSFTKQGNNHCHSLRYSRQQHSLAAFLRPSFNSSFPWAWAFRLSFACTLYGCIDVTLYLFLRRKTTWLESSSGYGSGFWLRLPHCMYQ